MGGAAINQVGLKAPKRVVAVLGMHRSGTSCLTGTLQEAGLFLGDCHTWNKHNEKGNRENQKFVDLHDAILAANGGAWDVPPASVTWSDEHIVRAKELLAEHSGESNFGFKDPRALLVLEGWKALFPAIEFVGIYRHPNAVAKSLGKRSNKSWDESLNLWYAYNRLLYLEYRNKPFPILNFDDDEEVLDDKIYGVAGEMGLAHQSGEQKFYTADLRHNDAEGGPPLPWKIARLYSKIMKAGL